LEFNIEFTFVNQKHPSVFVIVEKIKKDYALQTLGLLKWENRRELPATRNYKKICPSPRDILKSMYFMKRVT
jgi:hypothetical protein